MASEHTDAPAWKVYGKRTLYDNPWVRLDQVDIEPPGGHRWWHHVVRLRPIAAAVMLDSDDRVLMLYRHRFVPDQFGWELPGGVIEDGEVGVETAAREAEEETGWRPSGPMKRLCAFEPMPGMVGARHEVYLSLTATRVGEPTDADEAGQIAWISLKEIPGMVSRGQVAGGASLVGLLYLLALRGTEQGLESPHPPRWRADPTRVAKVAASLSSNRASLSRPTAWSAPARSTCTAAQARVNVRSKRPSATRS
ncbi:NUDIX hydrolase [Jiangella muralis]|uniref:NUDIX hydrolase n=1 Tax=Jiangella muralis TaxID=702383 RepID=UPI0009FAE007|nr:NUDIX hydrolase [Jiangella muralis]